MHIDPDQQALYRRISDFAVDQLLWRILYINSELEGHANAQALADKLMETSREAQLVIVGMNPSPMAAKLADDVVRSNELFIAYVKRLKAGESVEQIHQAWEQNNRQMADLLQQVIPGQISWQAMFDHECDLLRKVIEDVNAGKFRTLTDITPLLQRLAADMADYLAYGVLHQHE